MNIPRYDVFSNYREQIHTVIKETNFWNRAHTCQRLNTDDMDLITKMNVLNDHTLVIVDAPGRMYIYCLLQLKTLAKTEFNKQRCITTTLVTDYGVVCSCVTGHVTLTKILNVDQGYELLNFALFKHAMVVYSLTCFNNILLSGSDDQSLKIYDLENFKLIKTIHFLFKVRCADINEKWMVVGGLDPTIVVFNKNYEQVFELTESLISSVYLRLIDE
ncbi:hypothetical protein RF11_00023 [Thelohanellus kitauei]|uniref:Uncharacterized protein n=1 Tax=Thelohanellus kitauei TaxID=669202 RepID=A0A0C2J899_THEKT|nr:hypothetical protein RF11_00023 [Thelohanellus kitauei]